MVVQFLVNKGYKDAKTDMVPMLTGGLHLCLVIALYLMIFKPGL